MTPSYSVVLLFFLLIGRSKDVRSYSKVLTMGAGNNDNGPKIYKAMNMDLIFPKTFNSSEHVISTTQTATPQRYNEPLEFLLPTTDDRQFTPGYSSLQTTSSASERLTDPTVAVTTTTMPTNHYHPSFVIAATANNNNNVADNLEEEESEVTLPPPATGRAVDYRPAYPFSQLLTPNSKGYSYSPSTSASAAVAVERSRPVPMSKSKSGSGQQRVVYPSYQASRIPSRAEIDKLSGKDRSIIPIDALALHNAHSYPTRLPSIDSFNQSTDLLILSSNEEFDGNSGSIQSEKILNSVRKIEPTNSTRSLGSAKSSQFSEAVTEARSAVGRVKKYSYFYIARTIWYVPLFFCVWLSFYYVLLIFRSSLHHKATISKKYKDKLRSFGDMKLEKEDLREFIDELTINVMESLMKFRESSYVQQ